MKACCTCDGGYLTFRARTGWQLSVEPSALGLAWEGTAHMTWRRSSYSDAGTCMNCVEVGIQDNAVVIRDSKDPDGPTLTFTRDEWVAFTLGVLDGEFALPTAAVPPR